MGLENLSSPFSDISENKSNMSDVKSDQVESLYDDVFPNKLNDTNINIEVGSDNKPVSSIQSLVFQDVYTGTYSSNFTSLNHVLQADGTYKPYEPVRYGVAEDSPIGKKLTSSEEQASSNLYSGHENQQGIVVNNVKYEGLINNTEKSIRFRHVDGANIGKNNVLGAKGSDLTLESIFDPTHGAGSVNILRPAGVGSTKYLDIRASHQEPWRIGANNSREPYIVKSIPKESQYKGWNDRDSEPIDAAQDDFIRFGKFYSSTEGLQSLLKENITNNLYGDAEFFKIPPNPGAGVMAPPIPITMTGFLNNFHQNSQGAGLGSIRKPFKIQYSDKASNGLPFGILGDTPIGIKQFKEVEIPPEESGFIKKGLAKLKKVFLEELKDSKFAQIPVIGRPTPFIDLSDGAKSTNYRDVIASSGVEVPENDFDGNVVPPLEELGNINQGDFYVRIKDLRVNEFIYFRGYVTGITENITPSFNPTQYIGRSEDVYTYEKAERDLSFNLNVYPANAIEFEIMYEKLDRLTSLAYPQYQAEANDSSLIRMKAPFTELYMGHIGDKSRGQFGFIKSLTYTIPEAGDWDALQALPRMFEIALTYQILSKRPPQLGTKFYRSHGQMIGE